MESFTLEFDQQIPGLIVDGIDGTPYVAGTLSLNRESGLLVEVPYIGYDDDEQFKHVRNWFDARKPPSNLLFVTSVGTFSLFDVEWSGHTENYGDRLSVGLIRPSETVLAPRRSSELSAPLKVTNMRSKLDGLGKWASASSLKPNIKTNPDGTVRKFTLDVESPDAVEWVQGNAKMAINAAWRTVGSQDSNFPGLTVIDDTYLESHFDDPRPFQDHLVEQRKIADLLVLLFGKLLSFRNHYIRDCSFEQPLDLGQTRLHIPYIELVSKSTIREKRKPAPSRNELGFPLAYLNEVGPQGLEAWSSKYNEWRRFIHHTTRVLQKSDAYVDDFIIETSISIEAAGELLGKQEGEKCTYSKNGSPTAATKAFRCLKALDLKWCDAVSDIGLLARSLTAVYHGIKHPDNDYPNMLEMDLTYNINLLVVRLLALYLVDDTGALLAGTQPRLAIDAINRRIEALGLKASQAGRWEKA